MSLRALVCAVLLVVVAAGPPIAAQQAPKSAKIGTGFVASLARPGGNVTGLSTVSAELSGKRLALLREAVPGLSRVAFLWNPDVRGALPDYKETEASARSLRLELQSIEVSSAADPPIFPWSSRPSSSW